MKELKQWQRTGQFFDYQGHQIFYVTEGNIDAPTLLLIHGFPTSSFDWRLLWPELREHFYLVTLDMMGFGLSDKPTNYEYSICDQADIFDRLLALKEIDEFHILAHDYGDTITQELLARDRERKRPKIKSAILLNGGLFPESHRPVLIQKLLMSPLGSLVAQLITYSKFKKSFAHICAKKLPESELEVYWQLVQMNNGLKVMPKLIHYITERKRNRERWVGALIKASCPIRFINGLEDPISGEHMVERYLQVVPNPDVVGLKHIGHYPQVESPKKVLEEAWIFWEKNGC